jgi:hypothetical protein
MSAHVPVEAEQEPRGSIEDRALRWIVGEDTGISSRAIWAVMMGVHQNCHDRSTPSDPSDFGRCYRLLKLIPELEDSLERMRVIDYDCTINGVLYPTVWSSFVDNYWKMKRLYLREHVTGSAPELYKFMKSLGL